MCKPARALRSNMKESTKSSNYYPIATAILLVIITTLHTLFMATSILSSLRKTANLNNYITDASLLFWHILIAVSYIIALVYTYKKRASLSKKRINFIVYMGFLLYIFLSFSGCFINLSLVEYSK